MSRYTADSRDRVRDAVDMVALVSTRTELRRAGVDSYFGLCPFHDERTASFHVRPQEKHYHCFGCQASGDPFDFVMETEGLDFKQALESLADRFGVRLQAEAEDPAAAARREQRERLFLLLRRSATYYARYLWEAHEAEPARAYLRERGLGEEVLREFRVGYAPSAWDRVLTASRRSGFSDQELLEAGLVQRSRTRPGQVYDRFRERIMFPAADARGRVHGFGARRMRDNQGGAKYVNSAEGPVFRKREVLFGIDLARAAAARAGRMVLVEGYTDVLALHQAGLRNVVGIMGTSVTEEQVVELERVAAVLELCLDADRSGQEAMLRASRLAAGRRLELRVVDLPEGTDPADLVAREGAQAVLELVEGSVPFPVFQVGRILSCADTGSAEGRDRALGELRPVLAEVPPSLLRDELVRRVAGRLELTEARLGALLATGGGGRGGPGTGGATGGAGGARGGGTGAPAGGNRAAGSNGRDGTAPDDEHMDAAVQPRLPRAERMFLALCLALPEPGARTLTDVDPDQLLTSEAARRAARHLASRTHRPLGDLPAADEGFARVVADLVELAGRMPDPNPDRLEHARLVLEHDRLGRAIIRARAAGEAVTGLAREREQVRDAITGVVARLEKPV